MTLQNIKVVLATAYVAVVGASGLLGGVRSVAGWGALATVALVPSVSMLILWKHPPQTMSETISAARR